MQLSQQSGFISFFPRRKADNQPWGGWNGTDVELEHTVALCNILKIIQNHPKYMGWGIFNEYVSQGWYAAEHTAQPMV